MGLRLEQYLNDLVAQGHNAMYRSAPMSLSVIWDFFAYDFPRDISSSDPSILSGPGPVPDSVSRIHMGWLAAT